MNKIVVFANQKGGVGKSTLCTLFADYLSWRGVEVCVIDTDLQKSLVMQRRKDEQAYGEEAPYVIQGFDVSDPQTMSSLMQSAREVDGVVLVDTPGNVSEDGLVPLFGLCDMIVCPYEYEDKSLDSTGVFVQVVDGILSHSTEARPELVFVPNRYDSRFGNGPEREMWRQTDAVFGSVGVLAPPIAYRACLKRTDTYVIQPVQRGVVRESFEFLIRRLGVLRKHQG